MVDLEMLKTFVFLLNVKKWIVNDLKKKLWVVCDVVDLESWMQNVRNLCFVFVNGRGMFGMFFKK